MNAEANDKGVLELDVARKTSWHSLWQSHVKQVIFHEFGEILQAQPPRQSRTLHEACPGKKKGGSVDRDDKGRSGMV